MSAMGERFLILEETADALDVIDPELAAQFRVVNGLPKQPQEELSRPLGPVGSTAPGGPPRHHEIRMDVAGHRINSDCSCGEWASSVQWDDIDTMVLSVRHHLGSLQASTADGIGATGSPVSSTGAEKRVG